jgi:RimJ/RimL family protein N-acetyltransferase
MREILSTPRLRLRQIEQDDLPALHRIFGDAECMRYYPATKSFAETEQWFGRLAFDSYAKNGFGLWAIVDKQTGEVIGDCGITLQPTPNGREPEIGYHLWRDFWGCGFASEAARATLQFGMQTLQMRRIVSIVAERNIPSQRVAGAIHQRMEQFTTHDKASGFDGEYRLYITERAGS